MVCFLTSEASRTALASYRAAWGPLQATAVSGTTVAVWSSSFPSPPPPRFDGAHLGPKSLTFDRLIRVAGVSARAGPSPAPACGEGIRLMSRLADDDAPERTPS